MSEDIINTPTEFKSGAVLTQMATSDEISNILDNALFLGDDVGTDGIIAQQSDTSSPTVSFDVGMDAGDVKKVGQSFQLASEKILRRVEFNVSSVIGSPPDLLYCQIIEDNGGNPTGAVVGESEKVSSVTTGWRGLNFDTKVYLESGVTYWMVFLMDTPTDYKYIRLLVKDANVYANGHVSRYYSGSWHHQAARDLCFKLYGRDFYTTGTWRSGSRAMGTNEQMREIKIQINGDATNNKITQIKLLRASDNSVLATLVRDIYEGVTLDSDDFGISLGTITFDWKFEISFVGGSTPKLIEVLTYLELFTGQQMKVLIDGVVFNLWTSISFGGQLEKLRGISITIPNPQGKHSARFHQNQTVEIQYRRTNLHSFTTVYKGYIDNINFGVQGQNAQMTLSGRDNGAPFSDENTVDDEWEPYTEVTDLDPYDIIMYIVDKMKTAVEVDAGSQRQETPVPIDYTFERGMKCVDILQNMAEYGSYEWFITYDGKLLVRPPKDVIDSNVVKSYLLGKRSDFTGLPNDNIGYILSENVGEEGEEIVNSLGLEGKDSAFTSYKDDASVISSRIRHDFRTDSNLASDQLQTIAKSIVDREKLPKKQFTIVVPGTFDFDRGDILYVNDLYFGFSIQNPKLYKVVGKTDNFSTNGFISTLNLADSIPSMTDTLKRVVF